MSGFDPKHFAEGTYQFTRPIRRVAVIGGGPSGLATARHLKDQGLQPRLFERQPVVGGTWNFNAAAGPALQNINLPPSIGDYTPSLPPEGQQLPFKQRVSGNVEDLVLGLAAPPPVYESLRNNICLPLMQLKDFPWPNELTWNEPHHVLAKYLQDYAAHFGLDFPDILSTSTRVERVEKQNDGSWRLTLKQVKPVDGANQAEALWWTEDVDAVIAASGHYSAPNIPATPGLQELWNKYKDSPGQEVIHSKAYRSGRGYKGLNVLLVGCGTSGIDINNDISKVATQVYHSVRETVTENPVYLKLRGKQREAISKPNARAVAKVKLVRPPKSGETGIAAFELDDGTVLTNVDKVIYCTGYHVSKPYLDQYHVDNPLPNELLRLDDVDELLAARFENEQTHPKAIFTNGKWYQNLWEDLVYRFDPTLAFVGAPVGTATFSFFEFQGIAIAHIYAGNARIPSLEVQERLYLERLRAKGPGRAFQSLGEEGEVQYVAQLTNWLNSEGNQVQGHIPEFVAVRRHSTERILANFAGKSLPHKPVTDLSVPATPSAEHSLLSSTKAEPPELPRAITPSSGSAVISSA